MEDKYIIFGMGDDCKRLFDDYVGIEKHVTVFVDNDKNLHGKTRYGITIIAPSDVKNYTYKKLVIVSSRYYNEIYNQCVNELDIPCDKIADVNSMMFDMMINAYILPKNIRIEASTLCQLNCKSCYMRIDKNATVGRGYLKFSDFKKIVDQNSYIKHIELSNSGEVFLNPELKEILEYAYDNNIDITMNNGVNFNTVDADIIEKLVTTGVKSMSISIDGTSQAVYSQYRRNGNYDEVIKNIRILNDYKRKHNSIYPVLVWQYILMSHNEHQVLEAKKKAEELGMEIFYKCTWDKEYVPNNRTFLEEVTGLRKFAREEYKEKPYILPCNELYSSPQINWDGRLLGCCVVYKYDYGVNVFDVGLKEALHSREYINSLKMLCGYDIECDNNNPCFNCHNYKSMKESNSYYTYI